MVTGRNDSALKSRVKEIVVACARLKVPAASIGDDQPLIEGQGGLGLDSIDVLELVVNIEKNFGVSIPDRETGQRVLRTVSTIVDFVKQSGAKA